MEIRYANTSVQIGNDNYRQTDTQKQAYSKSIGKVGYSVRSSRWQTLSPFEKNITINTDLT